MKKKLLFCIHNYFLFKHYILDLKKIENDFEITIIISNYLVDNLDREYENIKKKINFHNLFFVPYYNKKFERSLSSIFLTHKFINELKKKIKFKEYDLCISDNNFFIWQRIILDSLLSKNCKKIGVMTGALTLETSTIKDLLDHKNIKDSVSKIHKLRKTSGNRVREKKLLKKISNIKNKYYDIWLDRVLLSYFFHSKNFKYKRFDLNLLETDEFDKKIVFHYVNFLFWKNCYEKKENVILSKHENECYCKNNKIKKSIFLSTNTWHDKTDNEISQQVEKITNFANKKIDKISSNSKLYFKHHPQEPKKNIEKINNFIYEKLNKNIEVEYIDKELSLSEIACNFSFAYGMLSTALIDIKTSCNNIKVYCLKSLGEKDFGTDYSLKMLNEDIIFYDDTKDKLDDISNTSILNKTVLKRIKFSEVIKSL